ncbi:MAG: hypothetical protein NT069_07765 [Planctomycetota bacterium]|nr:hypothetical protein [Planctomycetota bacterium]
MQPSLFTQEDLMLRRILVISLAVGFGIVGIVEFCRIADSFQHNQACRDFARRAEEEGIGCMLLQLEPVHRNVLIQPGLLLQQMVPRYDWIEISGNGRRFSPEAELQLRSLDGVRWISLSRVVITPSLANSLADIAELETVKIDAGCDLSELRGRQFNEGIARPSGIRLDCRDRNDTTAFCQIPMCRSVEAIHVRTSDPSSDVSEILRTCTSVKNLCVYDYCTQSTSVEIGNKKTLESVNVTYIVECYEPRRIMLRDLENVKSVALELLAVK